MEENAWVLLLDHVVPMFAGRVFGEAKFSSFRQHPARASAADRSLEQSRTRTPIADDLSFDAWKNYGVGRLR
jgi:hypothetical protein